MSLDKDFVYKRYLGWCEDSNRPTPMNRQTFSREFAKLEGVEPGRASTDDGNGRRPPIFINLCEAGSIPEDDEPDEADDDEADDDGTDDDGADEDGADDDTVDNECGSEEGEYQDVVRPLAATSESVKVAGRRSDGRKSGHGKHLRP